MRRLRWAVRVVFMRILAVALFLSAVCAAPAAAQIYTWRDASGNLVLSNKPRSGEAPPATYGVPGAATFRTAAKPRGGARATAYDELIRETAERHGVSPDLVRAVIQAESGFNRWAVSPKGAMGLMQLMPATARDLGVADPFHPAQNISGGVKYLAALLERFDQDVVRALAAYNAGPERVERYNGVPPFRETRDYVKKITGSAQPKAPEPDPVVYKWIELVDGEPRVRYSNVPPKDQPYEAVGQRRQ
jgi:soluble lytic murein transglycosylase-like protein